MSRDRHSTRQSPRGAPAPIVLAALLPLTACTTSTPNGSADQSDATSTPQCIPGEAAACACVDGSTGAQTCQINGFFGACQCRDSAATLDANSRSDGGTDSGADATIIGAADGSAGTDGSLDVASEDTTGDSGACTPSATRCSGNGVQTCDSNGRWGSAVTCDGATPFCGDGVCVGPHCAPGGQGMTDCGATRESCCTTLEVVGGTYYRTYDLIVVAADGGPTQERDPATVSTFRLDKYLVTVGRFRPFVNAWNGGWRPAVGSGKHAHLAGGQGLVNVAVEAGVAYETGWLPYYYDGNVGGSSPSAPLTLPASTGNNDNLPVNNVTWMAAYAFCIWDGGFLPSAAEWEYAAAGGSQQRKYPWGSMDPGTANQYAIYGCNYPNGPDTGDAGDAGCTIAPVGTPTQGAGLWGQLDLAGDLSEWTLDFFVSLDFANPCTDCAYLTAPISGVNGPELMECFPNCRAVAGGYYSNGSLALQSETHSAQTDADPLDTTGFRCARAP